MRGEFVNRLAMFRTALGMLSSAEHRPAWQGQPPIVFTAKVEAARKAVDELCVTTRRQDEDITGATVDKAREEKALEDQAYSMGGALACWFRDQGDETRAAQFAWPISTWRGMRGELPPVAGPKATTPADYDITAETVEALRDELAIYPEVLTAPQQSIAGRKALTQQLRANFNEVEAQFASAGPDGDAVRQNARGPGNDRGLSNQPHHSRSRPRPVLHPSTREARVGRKSRAAPADRDAREVRFGPVARAILCTAPPPSRVLRDACDAMTMALI